MTWKTRLKNILLKHFSLKKKELSKEAIRISALRDLQKSDTSRWAESRSFHNNWNERTLLLSSYIKKGSRIIEFGAGQGFLGDRLGQSISYQPVDIVKRKDNYLYMISMRDLFH